MTNKVDEIMKNYEPGPHHERPLDDLDTKSTTNWGQLPHDVRRRCVELLSSKIPADILAQWKDQQSRNVKIGSDNPLFHHSIGMWVRNVLRSILKDDQLPPIPYGNGGAYSNWDDYYVGALHQFVRES